VQVGVVRLGVLPDARYDATPVGMLNNGADQVVDDRMRRAGDAHGTAA
jgi:hypothetical protein